MGDHAHGIRNTPVRCSSRLPISDRRAADPLLPSRTMGRQGLSSGAERRRNPPRRARIFTAVDVGGASPISDRPYRTRWEGEQVRTYLKANAGVIFDPDVVTTFLEILGSEVPLASDLPSAALPVAPAVGMVECARNVLGIKDADSAENNSGSKNIIIYPVACALPGRRDAPKLSGLIPEIRLRPGSYLQSFYTKDTTTEEFFCNFEVNPDYEWVAMEAGFPVVARGAQGEIRAIESPTHRFYIATLFQPQHSSKPGKPHPLVLAFVQAAADWGRKKLEDSVLE